MQNINEVFKQQKLLKLIQIENFVGWVYNYVVVIGRSPVMSTRQDLTQN